LDHCSVAVAAAGLEVRMESVPVAVGEACSGRYLGAGGSTFSWVALATADLCKRCCDCALRSGAAIARLA